ncbi:MAG: SufE family protein [Deltaproteobacteria bacterium]|nr:SufE family protein [Deltaproteobacteria bacterium]
MDKLVERILEIENLLNIDKNIKSNLTIDEKINLLIERFDNEIYKEPKDELINSSFEVMLFGIHLPRITEKEKIDINLVHDCQSKIWLVVEETNGLINLRAGSDVMMLEGFLKLLFIVFNFETRESILKSDISFIEKLGFNLHTKQTIYKLFNVIKKKIKT